MLNSFLMHKPTSRRAFIASSIALAGILAGCATQETTETPSEELLDAPAEALPDDGSQSPSAERQSISDDTDGGHAIDVSEEEASYSAIDVTKTGESSGDEADFYGENSAVFATNGATLTLDDITVSTDGTHANAVFSYGEGTTVEIANSTIETTGNCSGGIMVTGGGVLTANNLNVHTTGNSSASIRSDRGGGTQTVTGGTFVTEGTGSPAIYSTADVIVSDADLTSLASQGVVVEGKNSVTLNNTALTASNTTKNSDKSSYYQAVMIYQSMSGDAAEGEAHFAMVGGSLTNNNGDIFFVNNTIASIKLDAVEIQNDDPNGVFLRAQAAGWGNEGTNGGHVTLTANNQTIDSDFLVDGVSTLNCYFTGTSSFFGAINPDASGNDAAGDVYLELVDGATWTLTDNSNITSLTCAADAISLNGYTLTVGGETYQEGSAMTGTAIEIDESLLSSGGMGGEGGPGNSGGPGGTPPDGFGEGSGGPSGSGGTPSDKPGN